MSEETPDRTISGLPPRGRKRDLSGMLASNRATPADPAPEATSETPAATTPPPAPTPAKVPARRTVKKVVPAKPVQATESPKTQVTAYMSSEIRNRARAAFKFTSAVEGDRSWSEFVEAAVLAETQRREQQHNNGQPYSGGEEPLSPGRSIT